MIKVSNTLLTICIPTYEGVDYLDDVLTSLCDSIGSWGDKLEILISNNNTDFEITRQTYDKVRCFEDKLPITIIENEQKNLKLDGNLYNLMLNAKGQYLWFLCDDDAITEDAIGRVMKTLEENVEKLFLLFINYHECDSNLKILRTTNRTEITKFGFFERGDEFLHASDLQFGLVSSIVMHRTAGLQCEIQNYLGRDSLHIPLILQLAAKYGGYVLKEKLVLMRDNNNRWGAGTDQVIIISRLLSLFGGLRKLGYDEKTENFVQNYFFISIIKTIIRCHARGKFDREEIFNNLKELFGESFYYFTILKLVLYMPPFFGKLIYLLFKRH